MSNLFLSLTLFMLAFYSLVICMAWLLVYSLSVSLYVVIHAHGFFSLHTAILPFPCSTHYFTLVKCTH